MFNPRTIRIRKLAEMFPDRIKELEQILVGPANVYIDLANALHWQDSLGWHLHLHRIKQLFESFDTVKTVKLYAGTMTGDQKSEQAIEEYKQWGYDVNTKPVKIITLSIDASIVAVNSPALIQQFIRKALLEKLDLSTVEFLNQRLADLNKKGVLKIEDKKCNFDVEIGRDMLLDFDKNGIETFILWSGDSDFADPVSQLLRDGKKTFIFSTAGHISRELNESGTPIFELNKIKVFVCWPKELEQSLKDKLDSIP